ncbi:MAG: hypothetical protein AAFV33_11635 [Chloroflexota bacterium]
MFHARWAGYMQVGANVGSVLAPIVTTVVLLRSDLPVWWLLLTIPAAYLGGAGAGALLIIVTIYSVIALLLPVGLLLRFVLNVRNAQTR